MVSFISHRARTGYAETRKEILAIVEEIISLKGSTATHVSNGWWEIFRRRHPELAIRTVEKLSYAHSVATDATIINHYFDLSEKALHDNEILDSPQIFNCDETGLPLEHTPSSVIGIKGQKHPRALTSGNKKRLSLDVSMQQDMQFRL